MVKPPAFEIVTGSYEEFLLGHTFSSKENELVQSFAAHDHSSSIRCVAFCDRYVASGGADDRIHIYDLKTRKQHQTLTHHNATVTSLQFTENHSHLMSGSSDGVLAVVRAGNWQVEKIWENTHKGMSILDIAVHPSGKLALTLGADMTLATWNLIKGRQAYIINLKSKCKDAKSIDTILWAPDGVRFLLYGGRFTEIWNIESGGASKQIEHQDKVTACCWLDNDNLLVGYENGEISLVGTEMCNKTVFKAHESRIKALSQTKKRVVSISSNGEIKVWNKRMQELAVIETGCRLTCLCIVPAIKVKEENNTESEVVVDVETEATNRGKVTRAQVIEEVEDDGEIVSNEREIKRKIKQVGAGKKLKKRKSNASVK